MHVAFQLDKAGTPAFVAWAVGPSVLLAVVGIWRAHQDGVLPEWVSVRSGDFSRGFAAAGALFGLSWVFTRFVTPAGSARSSWLARIYLQLGDPTALRKHVAIVVAVLVVVAIAQEVVWRGLVTSLAAEVVGSRRAWILAAFLYAASFGPTVWALRDPVAGANPLVVLAALGTGLAFGAMTRSFGRLLPAVFAHVLFDWTVLMMFRLWGPSV